jgi:predicted aspartyl protease
MTINNVSKIAAASAVALSLIAGGATAYAKERSEAPTNDAAVMSQAKVSISEAIANAENQNGVTHFEVEILKDNARQKVLVDTQTGQVVKTAAADDDDDGDQDQD